MNEESTFVPKEGQIDYTNIHWAPVINCIVQCRDRILLLKRSDTMRLYPGVWNGTSGFLDDDKSLIEKVTEEMEAELGITREHMLKVKLGQIFHQEAPDYNKTWIVHPVLVEVDTDQVALDWESQDHRWVTLEESKTMNLLPGLERVLDSLFEYKSR
jgi:8-oxo-dGTP diphosphatase